MEIPNKKIKLKNIISSFKYWPRLFRLLWATNKVYLIFIILLTFFTGLFPTLSLLASQYLINTIQLNANGGFGLVIKAFIIFVVISILSDFIEGIMSYYQDVYQKILIYKLNIVIIEKANSLSLRDFENHEIYDKLSRAKNEVSFRPYQILTSFLSILSTTVTLISSMLVVLAWKPWALIILILFPIISSLYTLKIGQLEFLIQRNRTTYDRKQWYLSYLLTTDISFKEIKLYNIGLYILNKYKSISEQFLNQDKYIARKKTFMTFFSSFMEQVAGDITLLLVIWSAFTREILIGSTVGLIRAISLVQGNVKSFVTTIFNMYENNLFIEQLFEFLDVEPSKIGAEDDNCINIEHISTIEFKNLYFKYPSRKEYALENINLKIQSGENIALVGKNGSGKTTLIKLLCGLYEVTSGDILINGISIKKINISSLQNKIATVFQDFLRYELTARENIGLGNLELIDEDDKLMKVAQDAGIYSTINELPKKLNSQLGTWFKEGIQLSGGQWQKVALARAFSREADIFILDEPSSALDPLAEREMFNKFRSLIDNKIGLFITHRFINAKYATRIVVLDKGRIVEDGNHDELIRNSGYYKALYDIQYNIYQDDSKCI